MHWSASMQIKHVVYSGHANWVSYLFKLNVKAALASADLFNLTILNSSMQTSYEVPGKLTASCSLTLSHL